jgi:Ca2+/Na+ antiporter
LNVQVFTIAGAELLKPIEYFTLIHVNLTAIILGLLFILGGMFMAFAKQKTEDEFIIKLRLLSFQWAILINYSLLLFCFIFIYDLAFLNVMIYTMFTVLILFIIRFHYLLYKYNDASNDK